MWRGRGVGGRGVGGLDGWPRDLSGMGKLCGSVGFRRWVSLGGVGRLSGASYFGWMACIRLNRLSGASDFGRMATVRLNGLTGTVHFDGAVVIDLGRAVSTEASADRRSHDAGGRCDRARGNDLGGTAVVGVE